MGEFFLPGRSEQLRGRRDFPLRGRFSRSEQLRQALDANPEAKYSMEELNVADAFEELPLDMRARIASGEKTGE